ncbi:MAG: hypothetical protein ACYDDA_09090 [Acidiferrobacteraceae bacterium]
MGIYPCKHCGALFVSVTMTQEEHALGCPYSKAKYPCRYCRRPMYVTAYVFDENPFCAACLHERMTRTPDPLDGPRIECGLPH